MELMFLKHTTHLSLLHNIYQILRRILKKCLNSYMLPQYLRYKKSNFQKDLI